MAPPRRDEALPSSLSTQHENMMGNTESQAWLLDRSLLDIMLQDAPFHIADKKGVLLVRPHMEQIVEKRLNCGRGIWSRGR